MARARLRGLGGARGGRGKAAPSARPPAPGPFSFLNCATFFIRLPELYIASDPSFFVMKKSARPGSTPRRPRSRRGRPRSRLSRPGSRPRIGASTWRRPQVDSHSAAPFACVGQRRAHRPQVDLRVRAYSALGESWFQGRGKRRGKETQSTRKTSFPPSPTHHPSYPKCTFSYSFWALSFHFISLSFHFRQYIHTYISGGPLELKSRPGSREGRPEADASSTQVRATQTWVDPSTQVAMTSLGPRI